MSPAAVLGVAKSYRLRRIVFLAVFVASSCRKLPQVTQACPKLRQAHPSSHKFRQVRTSFFKFTQASSSSHKFAQVSSLSLRKFASYMCVWKYVGARLLNLGSGIAEMCRPSPTVRVQTS